MYYHIYKTLFLKYHNGREIVAQTAGNNMKITLDEIARMANVSKATVSRVLNNVPGGVGDETRRRVKDVLTRMNYQVDDVRRIRSRSIGLIVPDIANPFFAKLAQEISDIALQRDYTVLFGNSNSSEENEARIITAFVAKRVDGVVLVPVGSEYLAAYQLFSKYKVPCVLLDRDIPGMEKCASVLADNESISFACCELLIGNGSTDIAYIMGPSETYTAQERLKGYRRALERYGLPYDPERVCKGSYTIESGYNAILGLERAGVKYSAVLCANDLMAMGAIRALRELSRRIPDDVEVIGFDNIEYAQYTNPSLTTVQQPTVEMGRKAVRLIIDAIEGRLEQMGATIHLQPKLLRRMTTRQTDRKGI